MADVTIQIPAQTVTASLAGATSDVTRAEFDALTSRVAAIEGELKAAAAAFTTQGAPSPTPTPSPSPSPVPAQPVTQGPPTVKIGLTSYSSATAALAAAKSGDTLEFMPAVYQEADANNNRTGLLVTVPGITLKGGPGVVIVPKPNVIVQMQKAALLISAKGVVVDGFEVSGVQAGNGQPGDNSVAAVCIDTTAPDAILRNVVVHDSTVGFRLIGGADFDVLMEDCEAYKCGLLSGAHNLYYNQDAGKLTVNRMKSHDGVMGHVFKSRAPVTHLTDCVFVTGAGHIDISDGGEFQMSGGSITAPAGAADGQVLGYAMESVKNPAGAGAWLDGVAFVNQRGATFLSVGPGGALTLKPTCSFVGSKPTPQGGGTAAGL